MSKYPLHFQSKTKSNEGATSLFEGEAEGYTPIPCAVPKEFGGKGGGYSPEDLYILAVSSCFIATFKVFAEKANLKFSEIVVDAKLTIDRNEKGVPELKNVDLTIDLNGVSDKEKAETILAESQKYCLVANSLKSEKTFTFKIGWR